MKPDPTADPTAVRTERIVHVTECLAAGTLTFLEQATRELASAGVPQWLIYSRRPDTPADLARRFDARVRLVEVPGPDQGLWSYFRALRAAIVRALGKRPDRTTVHLHSSKAGFAGRLAMLRLAQRPRVLYSPHGLSFLNRRWWLPGQVFHALEWLASRVDSTLVGCSRGEARLLSRLGGRKARVLENAVDDSFLALERQSPDQGRPLVLAMGRVCYQKAPEVFAALAAQFRIAEVDARFVWIGNGDAAGEERLRAAGVEVTGWVDRAAVQALLAQAVVFVQTSRWEGMPLSVLQALAAGVPCVVTDVVGNRDAVRQGVTGFVTRRMEETLVCVRRLLEDPALRKRFGQAARRDARRRFSSASFRARLLALYGLRTQTPAPVRYGELGLPRRTVPSPGWAVPGTAQPWAARVTLAAVPAEPIQRTALRRAA
jgi:glycosyltransferase involved in cell wall biosynthesis